MEHVQRNNLSLFGAYDNAEYGVVSVRSTDNRIEYGGVWGNKKAGLYLADRSNNNFVFEVYAAYSPYTGVWASGYGVQNFGFYVERGSTGNTFVDNAAYHDTAADFSMTTQPARTCGTLTSFLQRGKASSNNPNTPPPPAGRANQPAHFLCLRQITKVQQRTCIRPRPAVP